MFLGLMTFVSTVMTFNKWPNFLKHWIVKHELIADILAGFTVWIFLASISKTLTAVIGATVAEIMLGAALHWYVEQHHNDPEPESFKEVWEKFKNYNLVDKIKSFIFTNQQENEEEPWQNQLS
jgi:hypothetical protein